MRGRARSIVGIVTHRCCGGALAAGKARVTVLEWHTIVAIAIAVLPPVVDAVVVVIVGVVVWVAVAPRAYWRCGIGV